MNLETEIYQILRKHRLSLKKREEVIVDLLDFIKKRDEAMNYSQCCMSEAEQLFCDCEIPKPTDPYDVVDKHICRDCKQIIAK